jgi:5-methyltetrahydrofolate--homocysteine methyltransferase
MGAGPGRDILVLLAARPRLLEGPMGTMLAQRGVAAKNSGERNLTHPGIVAEVHREYLVAGAEVFESNSFAANRHMLERAGLGDRVREIQAAAVRVLREAVGPDYPIAANVGPTGAVLEPYGDLPRDEAVAIFREQVANQLPEGPDFILFETFEDLGELEAGIAGARQAGATIPIFACVSFSSPNGRTSFGADGARAAERLIELGVEVIGANCGHLEGTRIGIREMVRVADRPVMVEPNAGLPVLVDGETRFLGTPQESADFAREMLDLGVRLIGGCCGNTPEHIRAMQAVVQAGGG